MCTDVFNIVLKLANRYCSNNSTARNELIGLGYETILEFGAENLVTDENELKFDKDNKPLNMLLNDETVESKEVRFAVYNILKNKMRNYALKMGRYSPVFGELYSETQKKRYKAASFGNMSAGDAEDDAIPGEYCPVEISDGRNETTREMSDILMDASRFLNTKELEILRMRLDGRSRKEIAEFYGIKSSSLAYYLDKIARKLKPFYESLKSAA